MKRIWNAYRAKYAWRRIAFYFPISCVFRLQQPEPTMGKYYTILVVALSVTFLYLLLAFAVPAVSGPIVWAIGDKLDWESRRLAGRDARDCGRVPIGAEAREASECVAQAFRDKKPFRVRYDTMSVDEASAVSIVGAADGHAYHLRFLGGSPDGQVSLLGQTVKNWVCPEPINFHMETVWPNDRAIITCRSLSQEPES